MKKKTCSLCGVTKDVTNFYKRVASRSAKGKVYFTYRAWCLECGPTAYARLKEKQAPKQEPAKFVGLEFNGLPIGERNKISERKVK